MTSPLQWVVIRIPFELAKTWGAPTIKVRGQIAGFVFRTALFPRANGE